MKHEIIRLCRCSTVRNLIDVIIFLNDDNSYKNRRVKIRSCKISEPIIPYLKDFYTKMSRAIKREEILTI